MHASKTQKFRVYYTRMWILPMTLWDIPCLGSVESSSQLTGILVPKIWNLLPLAKVLGEPSQAAGVGRLHPALLRSGDTDCLPLHKLLEPSSESLWHGCNEEQGLGVEGHVQGKPLAPSPLICPPAERCSVPIPAVACLAMK